MTDMNRCFAGLVWRVAGLLLAACGVGGASLGAAGESGLKWEVLEKSYSAKAGEEQTEFSFGFTNASSEPVEIQSATTSCRCTAAIMPRQPWVIEPGASDTLRVVVDLRSRRGGLTKTVYVGTNRGEELLLVHVQVPPPPAVQREMNLMTAQADRQAILRGDCATCHVAPTVGKMGGELFQTACQICHGAEHRATMVPDLTQPKGPRDAAYWEHWIRHGAEGTLMPGFAKANGGPFDDEQIASLVAYLTEHLPKGPANAEAKSP